ncbi:MAG: hypothetical protein ACRCZI_09665 [Cetobacterium sp.]
MTRVTGRWEDNSGVTLDGEQMKGMHYYVDNRYVGWVHSINGGPWECSWRTGPTPWDWAHHETPDSERSFADPESAARKVMDSYRLGAE